LVCEIQVRTILQDAWAIISDHLSYKQESGIPKQLRRKLNALSGLFETADDRFDQLRDERKVYSDKTKKKIAEKLPDFLKEEINLDNLIEYLNWRFPDREVASRNDVANLLPELIEYEYNHLSQLDELISMTYEAVKACEIKYPPLFDGIYESTYAPIGVVRTALQLTDDKYLGEKKPYEESKNWILEFRHLVKK
jgi:GTP pyrophosphokinase